MKVPEMFRGMKLVKDYPKQKFARYKNDYYCECFSYYELGERTSQIKVKDVHIDAHM